MARWAFLAVLAWAPAHAGVRDRVDALELAHQDAELELRGPKEKLEEIRKLAGPVKAHLARAREAFHAGGLGRLEPFIRVGFVPDLEQKGETDGSDLIALNAQFAEQGPILEGLLFHEGYHLVQNGSRRAWTCDMTDPMAVFSLRWPDEATAEWVAWKLVPAAPMSWEHAGDISMSFFRTALFDFSDKFHPYRCFTFLSLIEHSCGVKNLPRRLYRDPAEADPPRQAVSYREALSRIVLTPGAPPAVPKTLEDLYVEFVVRTRWRKDFEPFRSIYADDRFARERERLEKSLGKPGELKIDPENKVDQLLPYLEGKEKKLAKEFPAASGAALSIVKEYYIVRDPSYKDESRLELSVLARGAARVIAFPMAKDGPLQPFYGTEARPASVPAWHTLQAAIVLVLDVSAGGQVPCTLTATVKPAKTKWRLVADELPASTISAFGLRGLKLEPGEALPADSDLPKQLAGRWIHATVAVAGRSLHAYGRFGEDATAWFWPPYLSLPPGTHAWKITTRIQETDVVLEGTLKCPGDPNAKADAAKARQEIEECRKKLAALKPEEEALREDRKLSLAHAQARLAYSLHSQGDWKGARETAEEALTSAPESARRELCELVSRARLAEGDLEGAVEWGERAGGGGPHYSHAAEAAVWLRDDLKLSWEYAGRYDAAEKAAGRPLRGWYMPKPGDEILR